MNGLEGSRENLQVIEIKSAQTLTVSTKHKETLGKFQPIGRLTSMYSKRPEITDIFDLLDKVSKPAFTLFNLIKNQRDPNTNISFLVQQEESKSHKVMLNKRLRELQDVGVIRKVPKSHYTASRKGNAFMVNPNLIMCPRNQESALQEWNAINSGSPPDFLVEIKHQFK